MEYTQEYLDNVLVRMAYHSSGIQGNIINFEKVYEIIMDHGLITKNESERNYYEILNHHDTFNYVLNLLQENHKLLVKDVSEIHYLLTRNLVSNSGQFKSEPNIIHGSKIDTALPKETPIFITQWLDQTHYDLKTAQNENDFIKAIALSHYHFERIHPFTYHNGPTGRAIILFFSMKYLHVPIIIRRDHRIDYLYFLEHQNIEQLSALLKRELDYERNRMIEFEGQRQY